MTKLLEQIQQQVDTVDLAFAKLTQTSVNRSLKTKDLEPVQDEIDALWAFISQELHQSWLTSVLDLK